jgi:hypothetical protein
LTEIARDADEIGASVSQPAQGVDADGIGRKEIGEVDPDPSRARRVDATQLVHLLRSEMPGEVNGAPIALAHNLNPALHESHCGKTDTSGVWLKTAVFWPHSLQSQHMGRSPDAVVAHRRW